MIFFFIADWRFYGNKQSVKNISLAKISLKKNPIAQRLIYVKKLWLFNFDYFKIRNTTKYKVKWM